VHVGQRIGQSTGRGAQFEFVQLTCLLYSPIIPFCVLRGRLCMVYSNSRIVAFRVHELGVRIGVV